MDHLTALRNDDWCIGDSINFDQEMPETYIYARKSGKNRGLLT
jgi:hypothetical protein